MDTMLRNFVGRKPPPFDTDFADPEREWVSCKQRLALLELIRKRILPNQSIDVDSALCVGLGSMDRRPRSWSQYLRLRKNRINSIEHRLPVSDYKYDISLSSEDEDEDDDHPDYEENGDERDHSSRDRSFYQLLLFETVLEALRLRFTISSSLIQDPKFTAMDRAFLERRGHTVLTYPSHCTKDKAGGSFPPDPSVLQRVSSKTFFFAPGLDIPVSIALLLAARPSLYWGYDMCLDVAYPYFLNPKSSGYSLLDSYAALAGSYAFIRVPLDSGNSLDNGFMYPVDTSDQKALKKVQQRISRGDTEAQKIRPFILRLVEENRLKQEQKPWILRVFRSHRSRQEPGQGTLEEPINGE
ncbi:hypothetical protein MMC13_000492 [Lambiella insularis]|nr:hypothetical protein [Lambiella insularis]